MRDVVTGVGIVHGPLCFGFPGVVSGGVIRKYPHDVQVIHVFEDVLGWIHQFTTKNEVQALGHGMFLCKAGLSGVSRSLRKW